MHKKETHLEIMSYQILKGEKAKNFKCGDCSKVYISVSSLPFIQKSLCAENRNSSETNVIKILKGEAHQAIVVLSSGLKQIKSCETNKVKKVIQFILILILILF